MGETVDEAVDQPDRDVEQVEIWVWDGDFGHVLGCVEGEESDWLVERGVLQEEDDDEEGVSDLLEGDIVYRLRKSRALEMAEDRRERLFVWATVDPATATAWARPF